MGRRIQNSGARVELFPFLSILSCIIGVLFLMIAGLALGQMGKPADDAMAERGRQAVELQRRDDLARRRLAELEAKRAEAGPVDTASLSADLERLRQTKDPALAHRLEADRLRADLATLKKTIAALELDRSQRSAALDQARKEKERRLALPTEGLLRIQPTGGGTLAGVKPVFVEAAAGAVILHDRATPKRIPLAQVRADPDFQDLLGRVAADPGAMLVIMIRSNGLDSYALVRELAEAKPVRNGKLPLVGQGELDLGFFKKQGSG